MLVNMVLNVHRKRTAYRDGEKGRRVYGGGGELKNKTSNQASEKDL